MSQKSAQKTAQAQTHNPWLALYMIQLFFLIKTTQKVFENVYNVSKWIKDGGIYLDAVIKNHDENIEEESWRKVLKPIIENCFKKLTPKKEELQKKAEAAPFNIKNCNAQFAAMNTCITLDAFLVIFALSQLT